MASIGRMMVEWSGGAGLPGVNVVYNDGTSTDAIADLNTFFAAVDAFIATGITVRTPSSGDNIEDSTGTLIGDWSGASGSTFTGSGGATYAAGVGVRLQLNTSGIKNGRRVRGGMFICPLAAGAYDAQGTLDDGDRAAIQSAADALAAAGNLVVWSRPNPFGSSNGSSHPVTSITVPDRITALRSRRY